MQPAKEIKGLVCQRCGEKFGARKSSVKLCFDCKHVDELRKKQERRRRKMLDNSGKREYKKDAVQASSSLNLGEVE